MGRDDTEVALLQFETEDGELLLEDDGTPVEVMITASERAMIAQRAEDEGITFEEAVIMLLENSVQNQQQIDELLENHDYEKSDDTIVTVKDDDA